MYANFVEKGTGVKQHTIGQNEQLKARPEVVLQHDAEASLCRASLADLVKQAIAEDEAGHYDKALQLYQGALEYFATHLKYEKNPRSRDAITAKVRG